MVALSNILDSDLRASVWESTIVNSVIDGTGLRRALINSCADRMAASVDDIFGMLYFLGKNYTVSDIFSAIVLGI